MPMKLLTLFTAFDKKHLLESFENEYYQASKSGVSINPVIHSFQLTAKKYNIDEGLVQAFLKSMKFDLFKANYSNDQEMNEYIYGSADVVGLMCSKCLQAGMKHCTTG